jgi:hypothetical protein
MTDTPTEVSPEQREESFQAYFRENYGFHPYIIPKNDKEAHEYMRLEQIVPQAERAISNLRATIMVLREKSPFFKTVRVVKDALKAFMNLFADLPNRFRAENSNPVAKMEFPVRDPEAEKIEMSEELIKLFKQFETILQQESRVVANMVALKHEEVLAILELYNVVQTSYQVISNIDDNGSEMWNAYHSHADETKKVTEGFMDELDSAFTSIKEKLEHMNARTVASGIRFFKRSLKRQQRIIKKIEEDRDFNTLRATNDSVKLLDQLITDKIKPVFANIIGIVQGYGELVNTEIEQDEHKIKDDIDILLKELESAIKEFKVLADSSHEDFTNQNHHQAKLTVKFVETIKPIYARLFEDDTHFIRLLNDHEAPFTPAEGEATTRVKALISGIQTLDVELKKIMALLSSIIRTAKEKTPVT